MAGGRKGGRSAKRSGKKNHTANGIEKPAAPNGTNSEKQPTVSRDLLMLERDGKSLLASSLIISPKESRQPGVRPTFERVPESGLLARARLFLPTLAEANRDLASLPSDPSSGIELTRVSDGGDLLVEAEDPVECSEDAQPGVVMDLALGILELKNEAAIAAAERALLSQQNDNSTDSSSEDNDSEDESGLPTLRTGKSVAARSNGQDLRSRNPKKPCKIVEL
eukprot:jgi/Mesvir1/26864/Mv20608-RA.1